MKKLLTIVIVLGLFLTLLGSSALVLAQDGTPEPEATESLEPVDSDGDGVPDDSDQCPDTPEGAEVDQDGCSVEATDEPADEPTEEPMAEPTEEATEEPTEEPADEPVEEPIEEPAEEPMDEPEESEEEPTEGSPTEREGSGDGGDIQASAAPDPGTGDSEFFVQNMDGSGPVDVIAEYFGPGCAGGGACEASKSIPGWASVRFTSTDNPAGDGWLGSVVLSSGGEVAALTNLLWQTERRAATYSGVPQGATEIFYPFLSAARNQSQTSSLAVQNAGTAAADITITYYNRDGTVCGSPVVESNVAAGMQVTYNLEDYPSTMLPNFDSCTTDGAGTWRGAAQATSTQPLAGVGIVHWLYYSGAYNAFSVADAQTSLNMSSVYRRNPTWGDSTWYNPDGWYQNSNITVQNLCTDRSADVAVRFYDESGALVANFTDQIPALSSHAYNTKAGGSVDPSTFNGLGDWYIGPAEVESTGTSPCPIVGVALTQWWIDQFSGIQNSATDGYTELFVPEVQRRAPGGTWERNTAIVLQNLSGSNATVDLYFYDQSGSQVLLINDHVINGNAAVPFNTRAGGDVPASTFNALGDDFTGSARITSDQPLLGIVNTRWNLASDNKATQWNMMGR